MVQRVGDEGNDHESDGEGGGDDLEAGERWLHFALQLQWSGKLPVGVYSSVYTAMLTGAADQWFSAYGMSGTIMKAMARAAAMISRRANDGFILLSNCSDTISFRSA